MRTCLLASAVCLLWGTAAQAQSGPSGHDRTAPMPASDQAAPARRGTASGAETAPAPRPAAEEEGDGRAADLLWIEGGFGYSYVNLVQFSNDNFIPTADKLSGSGFMGTLAAGFRISFLTLGARGSLASYPGFEVGTAVFDVALRLPLPTVEPYVRGGIGYGWMGNANYDRPADSDTSVYGLVAELGAGVDIYLDKIFAIGGGMDAAFLNFSRQRPDRCSSTGDPDCMIGTVNFEQTGDAVGLQLRIHAHASLHF